MLRFALFVTVLVCSLPSLAQTPTRQPLTEAQVPRAVKASLDATLGGPADRWERVTLKKNQVRLVATLSRLNPSTGAMVTQRVRYTEDGRQTSTTEYQAKAPATFDDVRVYLGTGEVSPALEEKVKSLFQVGRLISFERFTFVPGAQDRQITVRRVRLTDAKGATQTVTLDEEGRDVDLSRFPNRKLESEDFD
jgi:hypothetical protein